MEERKRIDERSDLALIVANAIRDWHDRRYACNEEGLVEVKERLAESIAAAVRANGYRKQVEGEWLNGVNGSKVCSLCGKELLYTKSGTAFATTFYRVKSNFCPPLRRENENRMKSNIHKKATFEDRFSRRYGWVQNSPKAWRREKRRNRRLFRRRTKRMKGE